MCDDESKMLLQHILDALESDTYEYSDPFTIGGATGQYQIASPYNTECEWSIVSATAVGTFGFVAPTASTEESFQEANVPATAGNVTLFTGAGELLSAVVTAAGTTNLNFTDGAGNTIATVVQPGTVGQELQFNASFSTSLVAQKATTTPVVTVSVLMAGTVGSLGTLASTATYVIGARNSSQPTLSATGADKFSVFGGKDGNPLQSYVGALTQQAPCITYQSEFMPLQGNAGLFLMTNTPSSTEILVTVMFRRRLERYIQEIPQLKPHTHVPLSGRMARTFMQGFADDSKRMGVPINPKPQEDTSLAAGGRSGSTGKVGQLAPVQRAELNALQRLNERVVPANARILRAKRIS